MYDRFNRRINYLRISVTDRCNFRCVYCMPAGGVPLKSHAEILTFSEIAEVVRIGAGMGLKKIRLTGGEPLVRKDLPVRDCTHHKRCTSHSTGKAVKRRRIELGQHQP